MRGPMFLLLLATLLSYGDMSPQFVTFKDGKLGVNFGGYHAGVGIGGLLGGSGNAGGLYAEAGTPFGQAASAGLGGTVNKKGGTSGGLFAGATAGGNVRASAGLAGDVNAEKSVGGGFASAQAGDHLASSGLGGQSSLQGSYGAIHTIEAKPLNKHVKTEVNIESANEVKPVDFSALNNVEKQTKVQIEGDIQPPVVVKEVSRIRRPETYYYRKPIYNMFNLQDLMNSVFEVHPPLGYSRVPWMPLRKYNDRTYKVYVEQQPRVVEKHIIHTHYKPHRHHFRKTAFIGGYVGNGGEIVPPIVHKTETTIPKRIDVGAEARANAGGDASFGVGGYDKVDHTYRKQVTFEHNPTFFSDIFNIPISTLKAVGNFLGNTAAHTNVSVQKSASIQAAETKSVPVKHDSSIDSSANAPISAETPKSSTLFDDILAIPISTLGAVNKFLENNVQARKNVESS